MLRAVNQVLKPGGLLSLFVIAISDGLSGSDLKRALDAGPDHAAVDGSYLAMFPEAGFENVDLGDVTDEYAATLDAWIRAWDAGAVALQRLLGGDEFKERQTRRRGSLQAVERGLLRRYLITAQRP